MATNRNIKENLSVVVDGKPAKAATAAAITEVEPALDFSDLDSPELYLNRELTWLEFNRRVLHEAQDESNPLLERLKFVGIVSSNLDEFFMKRIGGLKQQVGAGVLDYSVDGRLPAQQIEECYVEVRELEAEKSELVPRLIAQLAEHDIHITPYEALGDEDQETIRSYYFDNIYPLVTPQGVDSAHPFPFISNLSLNLLVTLRHSDSEDELRARVKVPVGLGIPRFLQVPNTHIFVPLESVMAKNLDVLFPNMEIVASETFYVTRNANAARDEDEADDLLAIIESEVRHRRFAKIVRVVVQHDMDETRRGMLAAELGWRRATCSAWSISKSRHYAIRRTTRSTIPSSRTCPIFSTRCAIMVRSCCITPTNRFRPRSNACCARPVATRRCGRSR
jgi:polyphosphate kinase